MFVLASGSVARQKLLNQIDLKHKVVISDFDEMNVQESDPILKVKETAKGKANNSLNKLIYSLASRTS